MGKILFLPFSIGAGLIAGLIATKLFDLLWGLIDDEEAPDPKHRDVPWAKVIVSLAIQGAIFRLARGLVDRSSRMGYERLTGRWPGQEEPDERT